MRTAWSLIVIPRSRSRSMVSRTWSCISRWLMEPVRSSSRSASVDLPWSMWAMMQKFRTKACLVVTATVQNARDRGRSPRRRGVDQRGGSRVDGGPCRRRRVHDPAPDLEAAGSLPPGYAATPRGLQVYGLVVLAIGLLFMGVALAASAVVSGLALVGVGLVAFGFGSVFAIRGEIATSRSLKR